MLQRKYNTTVCSFAPMIILPQNSFIYYHFHGRSIKDSGPVLSPAVPCEWPFSWITHSRLFLPYLNSVKKVSALFVLRIPSDEVGDTPVGSPRLPLTFCSVLLFELWQEKCFWSLHEYLGMRSLSPWGKDKRGGWSSDKNQVWFIALWKHKVQ